MIAITDRTTVGEIARLHPDSVPVFQQYGIDFCCGGHTPLSEACRGKGISVERFVETVEQAYQPGRNPQTSDWSSATLSQLIDHILDQHHAYLHSELPRLGTMLTKVIEVHGGRHPESLHPLGTVYNGLRRELEGHMWKEENVLFPLIKQMEKAKSAGEPFRAMPVSGPIHMMELEHESAGKALGRIRQLTSEYQPPEDACNTYRALIHGLKGLEADLHQHIHLENNILFPRAAELQG